MPTYLLIDPLEKAITLFTEPAGESYQQVHRVPFGTTITLQEPFSGEIDSSEFGPRPILAD